MKTRTFASIAVMSALGLLAPIHAHAFGLGKIKLSSALNQPFQAEIPVTALKPDDEGKLQVQLASNAEFEKAGLKRSFLLTQLKFEVVESNGEARILVSSTQPVKEPFIDFLLTATTGSGRLLREYTVLLDPPKSVFVKEKVVTKQKTSEVKKQIAAKTTKYKYPESEVTALSSPSYSSATSYGPVGRTDTLWDIARDTKPSSSISQNQMMMAILNTNPTAFRHDNINGLKAGYTLDIPSVSDIQSLSRQQAFSAVREQNTLWKNRNKAVASTTTIVEQESDPATLATDEQVDSTVGSESDEQNIASLQLVSPTDEASSELDELSPLGNKELSKLSEQLTFAQETIESQSQENIDIKSRMDLMEEQLQTLRQLITLKDADLAKMQSNLEADSASNATEVEPSTLLPTVFDDAVDSVAVDMEAANELDSVAVDMEAANELDSVAVDMEAANELDSVAVDMEAANELDSVAVDMEAANELDSVAVDMEAANELDSVAVDMETVNELDSETEINSAQSEVEAYFAQIGSETVDNDEETDSLSITSDEAGIDNSVVMEREQETSQQSPLDIAKNAVNTVAVKVKTFYTENKQESLIAGFVVALFALILLLFKARGRKENSNGVDTVVSGTSVTVGDITESTDSDTPEVEQNITSETDEEIIKAAYASLNDVDTDSKSSDVTASDDKLNSDLSREAEELIIEPELEELETLEPITLDDYSADTIEPDLIVTSNDDEAESVVEFNLDTPSDTIEPEMIVTSNDDEAEPVVEFNLDIPLDTSEAEVLATSKDEDLAVDDLLDFDLESISDDKNDAEIDSDILSLDENDLNDDGLDFGGSLELDTSEVSTLTLDDEPMSLDLDADLNDATLDDLNVDVEDDSSLNDDILSLDSDLEETDLPDINLDNVTSSIEPEIENDEPKVDSSELEFDLGDFDEIDEAETKLDLAGAYMDMGDPEGARNILEEVLTDGDDDQKSRAQVLLNDIS